LGLKNNVLFMTVAIIFSVAFVQADERTIPYSKERDTMGGLDE